MLDNFFNFLILMALAACALVAAWAGGRSVGVLGSLLAALGLATAGVAFATLLRPG